MKLMWFLDGTEHALNQKLLVVFISDFNNLKRHHSIVSFHELEEIARSLKEIVTPREIGVDTVIGFIVEVD